MYEEKIIPPKKAMPQAQDGTLRKFALRVPEVIYQCSGIMVFGKRIKSLVFSTDLSIIKNVNADAIIAVYPFTPQPIITQALLLAADIPVFAGVGGGLTQGQRVVNLAMFAEMEGATGLQCLGRGGDARHRAQHPRALSRRAHHCDRRPDG